MKRFSVTTSAGIKIQPYFDVPPPGDPNLVFYRVQSEPLDDNTVVLWVSASTANQLRMILGSIDQRKVSDAITKALQLRARITPTEIVDSDLAVSIRVSKEAFDALVDYWDAVSDEHRIQQLIGKPEFGVRWRSAIEPAHFGEIAAVAKQLRILPATQPLTKTVEITEQFKYTHLERLSMLVNHCCRTPVLPACLGAHILRIQVRYSEIQPNGLILL